MTTPSPAPQHAINAAIEAHSKLADNRLPTEFIPPLAAIITKHTAALSEENERLKRHLAGTPAAHVEAIFQLAQECGQSGCDSLPPVEFVRALLAAHPAQGMEGRG